MQPFVLRYPYKIFNLGWVPGRSQPFYILLRMFSQIYNRFELTFLPVVDPTPEEVCFERCDRN